MRVLLATAMVALLIQPVQAQFKPKFDMGTEKEVDPRVKQYRKDVEDEYNAALHKIPDKEKKNKSDPWADVRGSEPAKKKPN